MEQELDLKKEPEPDALAAPELACCFSVFMTASGGVAGYMCSHSQTDFSVFWHLEIPQRK